MFILTAIGHKVVANVSAKERGGMDLFDSTRLRSEGSSRLQLFLVIQHTHILTCFLHARYYCKNLDLRAFIWPQRPQEC